MKFGELKNFLSACDNFEIRYKKQTFMCDGMTIEKVIKENNLYDKEIIFIGACDKNYLGIFIKDNSINNTDKKYYKITLDNQEVLITPHRDFAVYMFKFIRELTEYKSDMQIIVGMGTEFKNSYIMSDFATGNKNLSKTLDKRKKV